MSRTVPFWCETCSSWRHSSPCGSDDCPDAELVTLRSKIEVLLYAEEDGRYRRPSFGGYAQAFRDVLRLFDAEPEQTLMAIQRRHRVGAAEAMRIQEARSDAEHEHELNGPASGAPAAVDERSTERATAESTGNICPTCAADEHYIPERDGRRCIEHPKGDHELVCITCMHAEPQQGKEPEHEPGCPGTHCSCRVAEWREQHAAPEQPKTTATCERNGHIYGVGARKAEDLGQVILDAIRAHAGAA